MIANGKKGKKKARQERALDRWMDSLRIITERIRDNFDESKKILLLMKEKYILNQISILRIKLRLV